MAFLLIVFLFFAILTSSSSSSPPPPHQHFFAPLIHITSPEHPLYNPNISFEEILTRSINISEARNEFLSNQMLGLQSPGPQPGAFAPISLDFLMKYQLGKEKVDAFGIPDSGSQFTWLQCKTCKRCFKQEVPILYDPRKSTDYEALKCPGWTCNLMQPISFCKRKSKVEYGECSYSMKYGDGTTTYGAVGTDILTLRNDDASSERYVQFKEFIFGCGINNTNPRNTLIPGIVGLGHSHQASLIVQMNFKTFSYCANTNYPENVGYIRFGSRANVPAPLIGTNTTRLILGPNGFYFLSLEGIKIGDNYLDLKRFFEPPKTSKQMTGIFIDSGTPITRLYTEAFDLVLQELQTHFSQQARKIRGWEFCITDTEFEGAPTITFVFEGGFLEVIKESFWISTHNMKHTYYYCLGMLRTSTKLSTLGMYTGREMEIGYDLENRLLWWRSNPKCSFKNLLM